MDFRIGLKVDFVSHYMKWLTHPVRMCFQMIISILLKVQFNSFLCFSIECDFLSLPVSYHVVLFFLCCGVCLCLSKSTVVKKNLVVFDISFWNHQNSSFPHPFIMIWLKNPFGKVKNRKHVRKEEWDGTSKYSR